MDWMSRRMGKAARVAILAALVVGTGSVGACSADTTGEAEGPLSVQDVEGEDCGAAFVDAVTVAEQGDGAHVAVVDGHYPSACGELGAVGQSVEGDTLVLRLCSTEPEGVACAQQLTPFTETLSLYTGDLAPGTYTVVVNEQSQGPDGTTATLTVE